MDNERAIHHDFINGAQTTYLEAVLRLQAIGYEPKEAEEIVSEWAEWAEGAHEMEED